MKPTFVKALICLSVMAMAMSCGKDSKSGGSNGVQQTMNPFNEGNPFYKSPSEKTSSALNNAKAWYESPTEAATSMGQKTEKRVEYSYNEPDCNKKTVFGFMDIEVCKQSKVSTTNLEPRTVNVVPNNNKAANTKLAPVFNPANGATLRQASEVNSPMNNGGKLFTLEYVKSNGHILQYKIDTGLNSAFNPVEIYDSELKKGEVVTNPYELR
jgi:hypothetical protein